MAAGVPWIGDAAGVSVIPLRAVAHFSGDLHSAYSFLHHIRRLRLFPLLYLLIIGGTYYFIATSSFNYIPGYYLSGVHRYTSFLAVGVGILFFLLTSFSDPGVVNSANVSQYLSAYPYDNIIFSEKECSTCKIPKPARSNTAAYVVAVLLGLTITVHGWHFLICIYGLIALALVLAGRMKELQVIHILTAYYGIENSFRKLAPFVVQWLLNAYNTQILIMVFLAVISLLLAGFFTYHAKLCLTNTTTNESFKWQEYLSWQKKVNEAKASAAALKASLGELSEERKPQESKWKRFFRKSHLEEVKVVKNNIYDRGFLHNIYEVKVLAHGVGGLEAFAYLDLCQVAIASMRMI
ncbi:UNVERIFIED_CONTAM: putative protein S-acyltransferase 17 [Sesamum calycinum]|uniref:Palmitoyltransferase n=1 Tax=Sesamum calycinum TaxID=2727403 RepID=A0AAW2N1E1_9LAMI